MKEELEDAIQSNEQLQVTIKNLQAQLKRAETDKDIAVATAASMSFLSVIAKHTEFPHIFKQTTQLKMRKRLGLL